MRDNEVKQECPEYADYLDKPDRTEQMPGPGDMWTKRFTIRQYSGVLVRELIRKLAAERREVRRMRSVVDSAIQFRNTPSLGPGDDYRDNLLELFHEVLIYTSYPKEEVTTDAESTIQQGQEQ